jgi:hypothetical protein
LQGLVLGEAAGVAGDIFRVRPPIGAEEHMLQLTKVGVVERI